ncbi:MAG: hypothetical protein LBL66_06980, partial [Clostridiales bacterium]|nr:hypothetical protein [Clostridiales bacterium]
HLTDENFLVLHGYESGMGEAVEYIRSKQCHLNFYAKDPKNLDMVAVEQGGIDWHIARTHTPEHVARMKVKSFFEGAFSVESLNRMIAEANANGYLVSLCHPEYNMMTAEENLGLEGLFAIELINYDGWCKGSDDGGAEFLYDMMLRSGKKLSVTAGDDNHEDVFSLNYKSPGGETQNYMYGRPSGFTYIHSENLRYESVIAAMENGSHYASCGPVIEELYIENGAAYVKTSPAYSIAAKTDIRYGFKRIAEGEPIRGASFPIDERCKYARFTVTDFNGRQAYTPAYYL